MINEQRKDNGGPFVAAIGQRKLQIQLLKDKVKLTEGFYMQVITTFTAPAAPAAIQQIDTSQQLDNGKKVTWNNNMTLDSSKLTHNPDDYKEHMNKKV